MAAITQLRFGYGGRLYGSFTGRTGRPFISRVTQNRGFGFGGRLYGTFAGRGPARQFTTRFTQLYAGYGQRTYGSFTGRVTTTPHANYSSPANFTLTGVGASHLLIGDAGGPSYELGAFTLVSADGVAILQTGFTIGNGPLGKFLLTGTGTSFTFSTVPTQIATGAVPSAFGLAGTGQAFGPADTANGSGGFGIGGSGFSSVVSVAPPSGFTLQDIYNIVYNTVGPTGYTLTESLDILLASAAGQLTGNTLGTDPKVLTIKSADKTRTVITAQVDGAGNRIVTILTPRS